MGKQLFKQFKLRHDFEGCTLKICDGYTEQPISSTFLYNEELVGLYYTLEQYLKSKDLIHEDNKDYVCDGLSFTK